MIKVDEFKVGDVVIAPSDNSMAIVRKNRNDYKYVPFLEKERGIYIEIDVYNANDIGLKQYGWQKADDNEIMKWNKEVLNPLGLEYKPWCNDICCL